MSLWCGWCGACVWSAGWRWGKSSRRTRGRSAIASRSYLSGVRWAWILIYSNFPPTSSLMFTWRKCVKSCLCLISVQGLDVLPEPSEGGWRRELKAAASSQRAERGVPSKACVLFTRLSCELQCLHRHVYKQMWDNVSNTTSICMSFIQEYIDGLGESKSPSDTSKMRAHVDSMLQDVRSSHRVREEQLASAARSYKKRLQKVTKTHQALLIAYRWEFLCA